MAGPSCRTYRSALSGCQYDTPKLPLDTWRISDAVAGGAYRARQHRSRIEVGGRLARRGILERFYMQLKDVGSRHDGPELLPGVERITRGIHMLLERIDPQV